MLLGPSLPSVNPFRIVLAKQLDKTCLLASLTVRDFTDRFNHSKFLYQPLRNTNLLIKQWHEHLSAQSDDTTSIMFFICHSGQRCVSGLPASRHQGSPSSEFTVGVTWKGRHVLGYKMAFCIFVAEAEMRGGDRVWKECVWYL